MEVVKRDVRWGAVKDLIEAGKIKDFEGIFLIIPRTPVAQQLGMNYDKFSKKVLNHELFLIKDLRRLAKLIDMDEEIIIGMVVKAMKEKETKQRVP